MVFNENIYNCIIEVRQNRFEMKLDQENLIKAIQGKLWFLENCIVSVYFPSEDGSFLKINLSIEVKFQKCLNIESLEKL